MASSDGAYMDKLQKGVEGLRLGGGELETASVNIAGLCKRVAAFKEFMVKYDIICLQETNLKKDFIHEEGGYKMFHKARINAKKASGGMGIVCKITDRYEVKLEPSVCPFVIWVRVTMKQPKTIIIVGSVYVPPRGSPYYKRGAYNMIGQDIKKFPKESCVYLMGDFNAKTDTIEDVFSDPGELKRAGLSPQRKSQDDQTDSRGKEMVKALCFHCEMVILNGRCGVDMGLGRFTCKPNKPDGKSSVVDYNLCAIDSLRYLTPNFKVREFDGELSDRHSVLKLTLNPLTRRTDRVLGVVRGGGERLVPRFLQLSESEIEGDGRLEDAEDVNEEEAEAEVQYVLSYLFGRKSH